jgi:prepilin-type N-terminal cleavage/methylation domain-containing protein
VRKGFTLIELLVVISIIALLLSILTPSLSLAKEKARRVICQTNLKQISLVEMMYANDNRSKLPVTDDRGGAGWFLDVPYNVAEMIRKDFGIEMLYCPSNRLSRRKSLKERYLLLMTGSGGSADNFDDIAGGHMVSDYFWLMEFGVPWRLETDPGADQWVYPAGSRFAGKRYFSSKIDVRSPATTCLVADGSFTVDALESGRTVDDLDFFQVDFNGASFVTNHIKETKVTGETSLYADGHVDWIRGDKMTAQFPLDGFNHWW